MICLWSGQTCIFDRFPSITDNAPSHRKYPAGDLNVANMNIYPGGKQAVMRDTWIDNTYYPRDLHVSTLWYHCKIEKSFHPYWIRWLTKWFGASLIEPRLLEVVYIYFFVCDLGYQRHAHIPHVCAQKGKDLQYMKVQVCATTMVHVVQQTQRAHWPAKPKHTVIILWLCQIEQ